MFELWHSAIRSDSLPATFAVGMFRAGLEGIPKALSEVKLRAVSTVLFNVIALFPRLENA
ncbi:MAG: hypothetical protein CMQ23_01250 [Gammaproteobacteria bacterium]|nr:hypothetical protein [Gammaproteobacteria bacterium]